MQKQNILKYTSVKAVHVNPNSKSPVMFENSFIQTKTDQEFAKKTEPNGFNYKKSVRNHTQGSQPSGSKKYAYQNFLQKDSVFRPTMQFRSKQNERKSFDSSVLKLQKGHSEKVFKFVGNFVNINKNECLRKQKVPDFFPISSKDRDSTNTRLVNNFDETVNFKVQPTKIKDENLLKVGAQNIYFKSVQRARFSGSAQNFNPQKSYLHKEIKTESNEIYVQQFKAGQKPQAKYSRKSYIPEMRKTQSDEHSFIFREEKCRLTTKGNEKNRSGDKIELDTNVWLKDNKENRKTIFEDDSVIVGFQPGRKVEVKEERKVKSPEILFSFLNKNKLLQVGENEKQRTEMVFKKRNIVAESDKKQARVNTEENEKSPKPMFFKQRQQQNHTASQMNQSTTSKPYLHKQQVNWQRELIMKQKIGEGTFGKVYKAILPSNPSKVYAVKKVFIDRKYKSRELQIVSELSHPQVMKVHETFVTQDGEQEYLNIVMDYYENNLYEVINGEGREGNVRGFGTVRRYEEMRQKLYLYQLLKSLSYIHSLAICHRDIKPHNMLTNQLQLVLCDFGSAKRLVPGQNNLSYICSRCYRAPELIFGSTHYTTQIDMWSVACVMLEMLNSVPLFIGGDSLEHLLEIIKIVGTPTKQEVKEMNPDYDVASFDLPLIKKKSLYKIFPHADPLLIDLINKLLVYSPNERLTAIEALAHPYFDQVRQQQTFNHLRTIMGKETLQSLYLFDEKEFKLYQNEKLRSGRFSDDQLNKMIVQIRKVLIPVWWGSMV